MQENWFEGLDIDQDLMSTFFELLIVLGIGLLVGLEREYSKRNEEDAQSLFAGVRTYPLVALLGYLSLFIADELSIWIFVATILGVIGMVALSYFFTANRGDLGGTSEFSLVTVFLLGSLVFLEHYHLAVSIAVVITAILSFKVKLHEAVRQLTDKEITSILQFVLITALILPLLPNQDFGPYGVLNPYKIWTIVAIFVALNFTGYFLSKFLPRERSVLLTGIVGGLVSSTATTWYFSRQSGRRREGGIIQAAAIILASSIMFPRILIWLLLLNRQMFIHLWIPVVLLGTAGLLAGLLIRKRQQVQLDASDQPLSNPINMKDALFFAAIYVLIQFLVGFAAGRFGDQGVYAASAISGLTDVDAITISLANLNQKDLLLPVASAALVIGALTNTMVKYVLCLVFGNANLRRYASYGFLPIFAMGIAYALFVMLG